MKVWVSSAASALLATLLVAPAAHAWFGDYEVVNVGTARPTDDLRRTTLTVQVGEDPLDTFRVTRLRQAGPQHLADPPVMLIPAISFPAEYWELTTGDYADSFAPALAREGYDVWMIDNRSPDVAPGSCESGAVDCSTMAGWDQDTAVEDVLFARTLVGLAHPLRRPVLLGAGAGGSTATATINAHPYLFEALVLWEGAMYSADPDIQARNAAFCATDEAALAAGQYFDPSLQTLKALVDLSASAPDAPSPIPLFPPGTTNLQALLFVFTQPDPSNPLNFTDSFIRLSGNPFTGTLDYADIERLYGLGPLVSGYASIAFSRDTHCAIGQGVSRFTDNLGAFEGDVLLIAAERGFGPLMLDTGDLFTSANVTIDYREGFGESDHYLNTDWRGVALAPLVDWLSSVY